MSVWTGSSVDMWHTHVVLALFSGMHVWFLQTQAELGNFPWSPASHPPDRKT